MVQATILLRDPSTGAGAAETGPVKKPISRTQASSAWNARSDLASASNGSGNAPTTSIDAPNAQPGPSNGSGSATSLPAGAPDVSLRAIVRLIRTLGLPHLRLKIGAFIILSIVGAMSQAVLLLAISEVVISGIAGKHSIHAPFLPSVSPNRAILFAVVGLFLYLCSSILSTFLMTSMGFQATTATRVRVVRGFFEADWSLQSTERLGHLQQILQMNSTAPWGVIANMTGFLQSLFMVFALLGLSLAVNPIAAGVVIVLGFVVLQLLRPINKRSRRANRDLSRINRAMATQVTEYTRLSREFRLFGVETRIISQLRTLILDTGRKILYTNRLSSVGPILYQCFAFGIIIGGVAFLTGGGRSGLAKDGAVLILVLRSVGYGGSVQGAIQNFRFNQGMLEDLVSNLRRFDEARFCRGTEIPSSFEVDFDSVDYSYDGVALALSDITMHIPQGKIVGLLGPSGSGKTTISQILLGLREPTRGRATIGGADAAAIFRDDAHSTVALVPQEPLLPQGSIMDNIKFFRDFEDWEVIEASKAAHLHEDVVRMHAGYETLVGESGGALSGGQKQRLAIARALVGSPKLIVLDEPTSAVDGRTERLIRQTLSDLRGHVTVVIISHRLETTAQCDMLLVLANGKIADYGERDAVLAGAAYRNIVLTRNEVGGDIPDIPNMSGTPELLEPGPAHTNF